MCDIKRVMSKGGKDARQQLAGFSLLAISVVASVLSLVFAVQGLLAPPPMTFQLPAVVTPSVVHAGDALSVNLRGCVQDGSNGYVFYTIDRALVERDTGARVTLTTNSHVVPVGCYVTTAVFKDVPRDLPPGVWHIEGGILAYGSHGAKLTYLATDWFTVVPNDQPLPQ